MFNFLEFDFFDTIKFPVVGRELINGLHDEPERLADAVLHYKSFYPNNKFFPGEYLRKNCLEQGLSIVPLMFAAVELPAEWMPRIDAFMLSADDDRIDHPLPVYRERMVSQWVPALQSTGQTTVFPINPYLAVIERGRSRIPKRVIISRFTENRTTYWLESFGNYSIQIKGGGIAGNLKTRAIVDPIKTDSQIKLYYSRDICPVVICRDTNPGGPVEPTFDMFPGAITPGRYVDPVAVFQPVNFGYLKVSP